MSSDLHSNSGGILSDSRILEELGKNIIIEPFHIENLNPNSYDITLNNIYYEQSMSPPKYLVPEGPISTIKHWGVVNDPEQNYGAKFAVKITTQEDIDRFREEEECDVKIGDEIIVIKPRQVILALSIEYIGGRGDITSGLHTRSTYGRSCVSTCKCAGFGDVGFTSQWVLEIENHTDGFIVLKVASRIAQIAFSRVEGQVLNSYEKKGNYQSSNNLEENKKLWTPLHMLPSCVRKYYKEKEYNLVQNDIRDQNNIISIIYGSDFNSFVSLSPFKTTAYDVTIKDSNNTTITPPFRVPSGFQWDRFMTSVFKDIIIVKQSGNRSQITIHTIISKKFYEWKLIISSQE